MSEAQSNQVTLDLGAMMDESLDGIPEAPDYANPPAGEYRLETKNAEVDNYESKKEPGIKKQRLKITYAIMETRAVAGNEPPMPDGTLFTETFQATEQGLGYFKKRIREIMNASDLAGVSLRDMMDSVKGSTFDCRITIRKTKDDSGKEFENVQIRVVPPAASA